MVGTAAMLLVTRRGAYLSPDGLAYVGTARNLLDGNGFTPPPGSPPLGNFPPLYPLVLAGIGALGPDPLTVARFVNPVVFGATILVVGLSVRRLTGSLALAAIAQLLVLGGTDFLIYHSAALSEPLFVLLTLVALAALAACLPRRRSLVLLFAALITGAACLTRYVGLAVVAAGAAGLVLLARRDRPRRWRGAIACAAIALAPLFGWLAWVSGEVGRPTNRAAVWHPPDVDYLNGGLRVASTWVLPSAFPPPVRLAATVVVTVLVASLGWRRWRARRDTTHAPPSSQNGLAGLVGLFVLAYLAALAVDRSLFDVTGRLDSRFLLPVHAAVIVLAAAALRTVDLGRSHLARVTLSAVVGIQLVAAALWVYDASTDEALRPGGFAAPAWSHSELIDQVRALPSSAPLYTNQADALFFHTGRVATPVPEKRRFLTGRINPRYGTELAVMGAGLRQGGLLVYFTAPPARRVFLPSPTELAQDLGLEELVRDRIGVAYRLRGP